MSPGRRVSELLFPEPTTTQRDYKYRLSLPDAFKIHHPQPKIVKRFTPVPYIEYMQAWRSRVFPTGKPVPFDIFIRPHPILRSDPRKYPEPPEKIDNQEEHQNARKNRLKQVIPPGISIDAVDDDQVRKLLLDATYQTTKQAAEQNLLEIMSDNLSVKAPLGGSYAPPLPLALPPYRVPYVSPEWRKDSWSWDRRSDRLYVDSTFDFWTKYNEEWDKKHQEIKRR